MIPPTTGDGSDALAATAADSESEKVRAGTQAGEYTIEAHVGAGAMGDVYRATHPVIGKRVAIKVIKRRLASSPEAVERFIREAKAVNRVSHPNVLDVFAMGKLADGRLFLAMDFLDGDSLGRRLRDGGPMAPERALEILRPVCDALTAAHKERVIHRDLKTDNIFLAKVGDAERVYVLDFGIAKVLADVAASAAVPAAAPGAAKGTLTSEGSWIGTPAYMAPEQWTAEGASVASDVYSLGIVAYEMLAGRPPFTGTSLPAIMEQHFRSEPPAFSTVGTAGAGRVPPGLEAAIARALAKKPEDRPASAQAFLADLEAGLGGRARAVSARPILAGGRRRLVGALAAVALVAGAVTAYVVLQGRRGEGNEPIRSSAGPIPSEQVRLSVSSVPSAARVTHDGKVAGLTPITLRFAPGEKIELLVSRAGYVSATRAVELAADDQNVEMVLDPVRGFEGMWKIPTGELRVFERSGEQVAAYGLDDPAGERRFLRFFEFEPDLEHLVFSATEEVVDARAPNAASCHIRLVGEYRYDPAKDRLELRRQTVDYVLDHGQCVLRGSPHWTDFEPAQRLASAEGVTSISSQGATVVTAYSPARTSQDKAKPIVSPDATKPTSKQKKPKAPPNPPPQQVQKNIPKQKNVVQQKAEPQQQRVAPQKDEAQSALPAEPLKK